MCNAYSLVLLINNNLLGWTVSYHYRNRPLHCEGQGLGEMDRLFRLFRLCESANRMHFCWRGHYPLLDNSETIVTGIVSTPYFTLLYLPLKGIYRIILYPTFPFLPLKESHRFVLYPLYTIFSPVAKVTEVAKLPEAVFMHFPVAGIEPEPLEHESLSLAMSYG